VLSRRGSTHIVGTDRRAAIVGPPDPAQEPWVCESDGLENLYSGRVYIRGGGNTREATADEQRAMLARCAVAATPQVDPSLDVVGAVRSYVWG
jgi:hypothetical protein